MNCKTIIFFIFLTTNIALAQKSDDFIFGWRPVNPSEWLLQNSSSLFTKEELLILEKEELYFSVMVNIKDQKVKSFKLDTLGRYQIGSNLIEKLEKILLENIRISKITSLSGKDLPNKELEYYLPIILKGRED